MPAPIKNHAYDLCGESFFSQVRKRQQLVRTVLDLQSDRTRALFISQLRRGNERREAQIIQPDNTETKTCCRLSPHRPNEPVKNIARKKTSFLPPVRTAIPIRIHVLRADFRKEP